MCVSGCPYKKITTLEERQGREVHLLLPAHRAGQPTVCSETCVGAHPLPGRAAVRRGRIQGGASVEHDRELYQRSSTSSWTERPRSDRAARIGRHPDKWMEAARTSPVYKMAVEWKWRCRCIRIPHPADGLVRAAAVAISAAANAGHVGTNGRYRT